MKTALVIMAAGIGSRLAEDQTAGVGGSEWEIIMITLSMTRWKLDLTGLSL